ncbi:MAG: 16S rRNA (cytosine(1402)-N(4))-methyltransferase RsmH [Firmicutes bacterium]|nr:16S rRNA (cytosine(1402)-N(4))-methyltransferase RsmH [Bacillota bacterium]
MDFKHIPVLLDEVINALNLKQDSIVIDATLGGGGHSQEILKIIKRGKLYGIDQDMDAIKVAAARIQAKNFQAIHGNFASLNINGVDAILADIGVSSHQIDTGQRGFSYITDGPLDMRMDTTKKFTAADLVNNAKESYLKFIIREYGEERFAGRIATALVKSRPHKTTIGLAKVIEASVPGAYYRTGGHPAKRTFQALRIEVNKELESLEKFLERAVDALNPGGRLAVISFHSLEDRMVKQAFKHYASSCLCPPKTPQCICGHKPTLKIITKKPITATKEELKINPRASSAKLRVAERI